MTKPDPFRYFKTRREIIRLARLCHVNSDEPKMPTLPQIKQQQFDAIRRTPRRVFDEEFGERSDDVAH
jgi:hypothetical protein